MNFSNIKLVFFDFDGVFTDNFVYVDDNGNEQVRCFRSDGLGLKRLKDLGILCYIISSEINNVVVKRSEKLNIPCVNGVHDKAKEITRIMSEHKIEKSDVMFVGNDINDLPALKIVGYPIGVADSFKEIEEALLMKTKRKGGQGAVREVCDLIYNQIQNNV